MSSAKEFVRAARNGEVSVVREFLPKATDNQKEKALASAVREGQFFVAKLLLEEGYAVAKDAYLLDAVRLKHHNIVSALLHHGVDRDYAHSNRRTALIEAVAAGDEQMVGILLDANVAVDAEDSKSRTALTIALNQKNVEIAKQLLESGASAHSCGHFFGWIIRNGYAELLNLLLLRGADPNAAYSNATTYPLLVATSVGCLKMLTTLLQSGANVEITDKNGRTALSYAVSAKNVQMVRVLVEYGATAVSCDELVLDLVRQSETALVATLVKSLSESNGGSKLLQNALLTATKCGLEEMVLCLLDAGVDVNSVCAKGRSAVNHAFGGNFTKIARLLIQRGAQPVSCELLMKHAIKAGNIEQVQLLLNCGADPNVVDGTKRRLTLILAAQHQQMEIFRQLLQAGADVNYRPTSGQTALMWAARQGNAKIVAELLKADVDVNAQLEDGWTAVMYAAHYGHEAVVQLLIDARANLELKNAANLMAIECIDRKLRNAYSVYKRLDWASKVLNYENVDASYFPIAQRFQKKESVDKLEETDRSLMEKSMEDDDAMTQLFETEPFKVNDCDPLQRTILMYMAYKGYSRIVELLLQKGAHIHAQDCRRMTALTWAIYGRKVDVVQLLVAQGASPNVPDFLYRSPLAHALRARDLYITTVLMNSGARLRSNFQLEGALIWAATNGYSFIVHELCRVRVNVNEVDDYGTTALIWASYGGHIACMMELLKAGPNINVVDDHGRTALWYALDQGHDEAVKILLPGAGLKDIDRGIPALCKAVRHGSVENVCAMLERGASQYWTEPDGTTALMCASWIGSVEIVELLLKKGAEVHVMNQAGDTAMHFASSADAPQIIELLNEYGANTESKNGEGLTPLLLASRRGNSAAVEALLKCEANVRETDPNGKSAIDLAIREGEDLTDGAALVGETLIAWGSNAQNVEKAATAILEHLEKKKMKEEGEDVEAKRKQDKLSEKPRPQVRSKEEVDDGEADEEDRNVFRGKRWPVDILVDLKGAKKRR